VTDIETIADLERVSDSLNIELFNGELRALPIRLHSSREEYGLYLPDRYISVHRHIAQHASAEMIARTITHELCHQATHKSGDEWHDRAWSQEMLRVGLASDTSIIEGGAFAQWMASR
jgi:predicted SprT family Zn-dependent metalloprotease